MTIKKEYSVGDEVWIYGINRSNTKPAKGKVIKIVDLSDAGYAIGPFYIIEIPTHIDPLLEIRSWESISQDEKGPVGALRHIGNFESTIKFASRVGFAFDDDTSADSSLTSEHDEDSDEEISPEQIHAALEKSRKGTSHQPLIIKENKPRRRPYKRKKS